MSQDHDHVAFGPRPVRRFQYRRRWTMALNITARRGEIAAEDYWKLRRASFQPKFMDGLIDEIERTAKVAGGWVEDVQEWFAKLVDWIVENWDTIIKVALTLLMFVI